MIKYLGSKKRFLPVLGAIVAALEPSTALDLFTGTTRVAQEFKRRGIHTTCVDTATYSHILAQTYIVTDSRDIDPGELFEAVAYLNSLPGSPGYFTATFCEQSRFFHPKNGARIDAIREALNSDFDSSPLYPILLSELMLAADRVDSTTGIQMAYLKQWAPRALNDLTLRTPTLLPGGGNAICGDATAIAPHLPRVDVAYLDPPYNQHRYFSNYHIWETLVRWDKPSHYGVACKRVDVREAHTKSRFNGKRSMPDVLKETIEAVNADALILSYNNESWVTADDLLAWCRAGREDAILLQFDSKRYVGAQIGVFDPDGRRVGEPGRLRNVEYIIVAGDADRVRAAAASMPSTAAPFPV